MEGVVSKKDCASFNQFWSQDGLHKAQKRVYIQL